MLHLCWLTSYGWAEMLPTESATQTSVQDDRQRILDLLNRQEVVDELEKYGISKVEAAARINSLTDEELTVIVRNLDELPEGGGMGGEPISALFTGALIVSITFLSMIWAVFICPFSKLPFAECLNENIWTWKGPNDSEGNESGYDYCVNDCDSDYNSCMKSSNSDPSKEQDCDKEVGTCTQKCLDWSLK